MTNYRFETLAVQGGLQSDPTNAHAVPLYRTSAYTFNSARHAADLFALKAPGHLYTRLSNPTQDVLEARMTMLEGGAGALALSSGTAAIFYSIINLAREGDEIVASSNLYGGTFSMFTSILPQFGLKVRLVNPHDLNEFAGAINDKTRAIFVESIGNPTLSMVDMEALADLAHENGLPLIVDSTFATPYLMRPIDFGADIVIHSLTKWIGGHGTGLGGIVVDSGKFDWKNPRFSLYNDPDPNYHGLRWAHDMGDIPPFITRMRTVPLRNLGACLGVDNVWMFLQGLETLALRMERHCRNALSVAEYLQRHPKVDWVRYPGLPGDPSHELMKKYLPRGGGGMVVFGLKAPGADAAKAAGERFIDGLGIFALVANVGDVKSLALHPASTTHSQLSGEEQKLAGLRPEMIRLSVGIEHIDDLLADLEQALGRVD